MPIGPVVGPLVIVGVLVDENGLEKLKEAKVRDSKLLSLKQIKELQKKINKIAKKIKVVLVQPNEIDNAVSGEDGLNLNWLEAKKSAEIINELNPDKVILDCPSPNIEKYKGYLRKLLKNKDIEIIAEHKADKNFPIVSASSIIAKFNREEEVKKIEKMIGQSIGTGYISNPICQKFLKENWEKYPEIFRKSWVSWKNHKIEKEQKKLMDF